MLLIQQQISYLSHAGWFNSMEIFKGVKICNSLFKIKAQIFDCIFSYQCGEEEVVIFSHHPHRQDLKRMINSLPG